MTRSRNSLAVHCRRALYRPHHRPAKKVAVEVVMATRTVTTIRLMYSSETSLPLSPKKGMGRSPQFEESEVLGNLMELWVSKCKSERYAAVPSQTSSRATRGRSRPC